MECRIHLDDRTVLDRGCWLLLIAGSSGKLVQVDLSNLCLFAIEDLGNFFQGRATSLDVQEEDEDKFESDPALLRVSVSVG